MQDAFRYCFRFCCDPGFNDETETQSLLRFCSEALVDDVMVFVNVQELNTGHLDEREQAVYLRLLERLGPLLAARGVTLSVNHWHSLMHADLGKSLRDGQDFTLMVDPEGRAASLCVCPESGAWRRYIGGVYARYAALHPDTVWVEDDFRLHNHAPLAWGGCFCDGHMRRFSERAGLPAGETLAREAFLAGVLRSGGDVRMATIIDLVPLWGVAVPLTALCALVLEAPLPLVCIGIYSENLCKMPWGVCRLRSRKWINDVTGGAS